MESGSGKGGLAYSPQERLGYREGSRRGGDELALTIEQLRNLDDDDLVSAVFSEWDDAPKAPEGCWLVYLMCIIIEGDIYNGGFAQFLGNIESDLLDEAIEAYGRFGLNDMASLMQKAKRIYDRKHDTLKRQSERAGASHPDIDELDDRYSEIEDSIRAARVNFIRSNPSLFVTA